VTFFACFLTFAHRFFAALAIDAKIAQTENTGGLAQIRSVMRVLL
jgi:hypothetical protein